MFQILTCQWISVCLSMIKMSQSITKYCSAPPALMNKMGCWRGESNDGKEKQIIFMFLVISFQLTSQPDRLVSFLQDQYLSNYLHETISNSKKNLNFIMEVASRVSMIRKNPPDDFENYFIWKVDVEQNTLPEVNSDKNSLTARIETLTVPFKLKSWSITILLF